MDIDKIAARAARNRRALRRQTKIAPAITRDPELFDAPCIGARRVYWWINGFWVAKGWLMPESAAHLSMENRS